MTYAKSLSALADDTRRDIFESLRTGPKSVTTLAYGRPISRPAVSQHLKVLADAGLVSVTAEGTSRVYAIDPNGLAPLRQYLDNLWGDVLGAFAAEVEKQMETRTQEDGHE